MVTIDNYTDKEIVDAILNRNAFITKEFLYRKCYPLFFSIQNKYYTDCDTCIEFINEIYVFILKPKKDGRCKLEDFAFRCTLTLWLKIVAENFCHHLFTKKVPTSIDSFDIGDRFFDEGLSLVEMDLKSLNMADVNRILDMMPNQRYRTLIRLRYLEEKTNEETANQLEMSMDNYYNKHRLAKAQFVSMLRKEGLL